MGVGGECHASASLPPGKDTLYPLYSRLGGPQGWSGRIRKILPPPGFNPRTIQPVARRYTVYAPPAPELTFWYPEKCDSWRPLSHRDAGSNSFFLYWIYTSLFQINYKIEIFEANLVWKILSFHIGSTG